MSASPGIREQLFNANIIWLPDAERADIYLLMDAYAIKILKFLMDNSEDFDFISDKLPVNEVLESIKRHLK